jgi:hypothetical protein
VVPITPALVDEVWAEITRYAPERVQVEARDFLGRQPHAAAFARRFAPAADAAVQQAAVGLAYLLFKILERSLGRPFPPLAEERIARAWEANARWLERAEASPGQVLEALGSAAHPSLVAYILDAFYGSEAAACDPAVRAGLLVMLKTLTEALDIAAVEGSTP